MPVFSVDAYSGIDIYRYFMSGNATPAFPFSTVNPDKIFRHGDIRHKMASATFVRFSVFDWSGETAAIDTVFRRSEGDGMRSWFRYHKLVYKNTWEYIDILETHLWVNSPLFNSGINRRTFEVAYLYERNYTEACMVFHWFAALTIDYRQRGENGSELCPFEMFWDPGRYPDFEKIGLSKEYIQQQPPVFVYFDERTGSGLSAKVTIKVI